MTDARAKNMAAAVEAAAAADKMELEKATAELKAASEEVCRSVNINPGDARLVETDGACACGVWGGVGAV